MGGRRPVRRTKCGFRPCPPALGRPAAFAGSGKENLTFIGQDGSFNLFAPLFQSTRTLSVHMYNLMSEGLHTKEAQATAVVLLVLVLVINAGSSFLAKKLTKGKENG